MADSARAFKLISIPVRMLPLSGRVMKIQQVLAREVLDSRAHPTVEVEVSCTDGSRRVRARAIVPSGASTGAAEAWELRDGGDRYDGRGVRQAVRNVNEVLGPAVVGAEADQQHALDRRLLELDGTPQKSRLGANAVLGVSLAVARAAALAADDQESPLAVAHYFAKLWQDELGRHGLPAADGLPRLPRPMTNMISGGLHAGGNIDFQDFLVVPLTAPDYPTALEQIVRVYQRLGKLLAAAGYEGRLVGDEGGYGPRLPDNAAAAEFAVRAIEAAGLQPGVDMALTLDVASTHFYRDGLYRLSATGGESWTREQMVDYIQGLADRFPIVSIEDPLAEEDWEGWQLLTERLGRRVLLVGDDLFATNPARLQHGIEQNAGNAVLIKMNQIGTISETLETMARAQAAGFRCVVSARSGETEDDTLADLACGTGAPLIKIGSIVRSERLAKYNQLLRIAEQLTARGGDRYGDWRTSLLPPTADK